MPTLIIPVTSPEQLKELFAAQEHLSKAGVHFDSGSDVNQGKGKILNRCWELDWSLSGATLRYHKDEIGKIMEGTK